MLSLAEEDGPLWEISICSADQYRLCKRRWRERLRLRWQPLSPMRVRWDRSVTDILEGVRGGHPTSPSEPSVMNVPDGRTQHVTAVDVRRAVENGYWCSSVTRKRP